MDQTTQAPDGQSAPQEANRGPSALDLDKPVSEQHGAEQRPSQSPQQKLERRFSIFEGWMIALTLFGVTVAATTGVIFWKQLSVMSGQLREMKSSGVDTHNLAVAAGKEAEKAEVISASIQQAASAMDSSNAHAKTALDASIKAYRTDQRAWVGPIAISPISPVQEGNALSFRLIMRNSGKTPALQFSGIVRCTTLNRSDAFTPSQTTLIGADSIGVIQPGATFPQETGLTQVINGPTVEALKNGSIVLRVFGKESYRDIFNEVHTTEYCFALRRTLDDFDICNTYNNAN